MITERLILSNVDNLNNLDDTIVMSTNEILWKNKQNKQNHPLFSLYIGTVMILNFWTASADPDQTAPVPTGAV